jgi:hypothetical protein
MGVDVDFKGVEDDGGRSARNGDVKSWLQTKKDGTLTPTKKD